MKHKIVLLLFPFDDLTTLKVRPAICLTSKIGFYEYVVVAFITNQIFSTPNAFDIPIIDSHPKFHKTGLKVSSTIKLHR